MQSPISRSTGTPSFNQRAMRAGLLTAVALALAGCSILPTWLGGTPEPEAQPAAPVAVAPAPAPAPEPPPPAPAPVATPVTPPSPVVLKAPEEPPPAPAPAKAAPAEPKSTAPVTLVHGYYINVGLFAVPANGEKAFKKLEQAGLPVFSDGVTSKKKGALTRVRVGPYTKKADADAAAKKIHAMKLDAVVFKN